MSQNKIKDVEELPAACERDKVPLELIVILLLKLSVAPKLSPHS